MDTELPESYSRCSDEESYLFKKALVDLIGHALSPPKSGGPSKMQGWAVKLGMKLVSDRHRIQSIRYKLLLKRRLNTTSVKESDLRGKTSSALRTSKSLGLM